MIDNLLKDVREGLTTTNTYGTHSTFDINYFVCHIKKWDITDLSYDPKNNKLLFSFENIEVNIQSSNSARDVQDVVNFITDFTGEVDLTGNVEDIEDIDELTHLITHTVEKYYLNYYECCAPTYTSPGTYEANRIKHLLVHMADVEDSGQPAAELYHALLHVLRTLPEVTDEHISILEMADTFPDNHFLFYRDQEGIVFMHTGKANVLPPIVIYNREGKYRVSKKIGLSDDPLLRRLELAQKLYFNSYK